MTLYLARFLVMGIFLQTARNTWRRSRSTGSVSRWTGAAGLETIHNLERPLAFRIPRQIYSQVLISFFEDGIIGCSRKRHADLRLTPHIRTLRHDSPTSKSTFKSKLHIPETANNLGLFPDELSRTRALRSYQITLGD
jgi:hypothetical protein